MRDTLTKATAYFWRFGYPFLGCAALFVTAKTAMGRRTMLLAVSAFCTVFGIHDLAGLVFRLPSVYCELQNAYHQKMTPMRRPEFPREMKRDCVFCAAFFIGFGLLFYFFSAGA